MKYAVYIAMLVGIIVLTNSSCKKKDWIDWKVQNEAWLAQNAQNEDVVVTPTGLQYKVIRQGIASIKPDAEKTVVVNYTGRLITSEDAIFDEGNETSFMVKEVISGFAEGLRHMNKTGHYILYIPSDLGYKGDKQSEHRSGTGRWCVAIPPYSTLIFDVELLDVY